MKPNYPLRKLPLKIHYLNKGKVKKKQPYKVRALNDSEVTISAFQDSHIDFLVVWKWPVPPGAKVFSLAEREVISVSGSSQVSSRGVGSHSETKRRHQTADRGIMGTQSLFLSPSSLSPAYSRPLHPSFQLQLFLFFFPLQSCVCAE